MIFFGFSLFIKLAMIQFCFDCCLSCSSVCQFLSTVVVVAVVIVVVVIVVVVIVDVILIAVATVAPDCLSQSCVSYALVLYGLLGNSTSYKFFNINLSTGIVFSLRRQFLYYI